MPYRLNHLLRTLCLAGVAFAPLASLAQTAEEPVSAPAEGAAPAEDMVPADMVPLAAEPEPASPPPITVTGRLAAGITRDYQ